MENGCREEKWKERKKARKNCKSGEPKSRKIVSWQVEKMLLCSVLLLFFAGLILIHLSLVSPTTLKCCQLLRGNARGRWRGRRGNVNKKPNYCAAFAQHFLFRRSQFFLGEKRLKLCCHFFISSISYNILCNNVALQRAHKNEMNCEKCARLGELCVVGRGGCLFVWIGGLVGCVLLLNSIT